MTQGSTRQQRFHGRVALPEPTPCGHPGCEAAAEFRAPRSNRIAGSAGGWQWLCLDHVRAFNSSYNFFDGMSPDAIAAAQSPLAGWERAAHDPSGRTLDPLSILEARFGTAFVAARTSAGALLDEAEIKALKTLELTADAAPADIRRAYKRLLRRYHPDSNGGDRATERELRAVIDAHARLKAAPAFAVAPAVNHGRAKSRRGAADTV